MVQEPNACRDLNLLRVSGAWLAVEVDENLDLCLVRLPLNCRGSCSHSVHCSRSWVCLGCVAQDEIFQRRA